VTLADEQQRIGSAAVPTVWQTLRRAVQMSPELKQGIRVTLALAVVATAGRVVVPFAVQQTIDRGLMAEGGPTPAR
jgi:putative ABC transport system ATP-binding protein